jgi:hypothetical protein
MNDVSGKLPPFGFGGLVDSSRAQMNDGKREFPSFGLGRPFDSSRAQEQIHRHMLAQALSNWRKGKRGRPKAPWRENLFPAISRTMDSHPDKTDTERALIISEKLRPKVSIRTVQNWLSTVRKTRWLSALAAQLGKTRGSDDHA